MNPYYQGKLATIYHGDCRELSLENISAVVTDPPYGLGFMGKEWDQLDKHTSPLANDSYPKSRNARGMRYAESDGNAMQAFHYDWATLTRQACLPGAPLLSFGGTRTFHRLACAIEDAGWEIRDTIMWVYGSGFPKSLDIGKAIDKLQGNVREILGYKQSATYPDSDGVAIYKNRQYSQGSQVNTGGMPLETKGTTVWEGYGTALKPAYEPIILGMNPLDGTFAENALKHKVAGLNIDECRITIERKDDSIYAKNPHTHRRNSREYTEIYGEYQESSYKIPRGRFPANFIHDGSQLVLELFPEAGNKWKRNYGEEDYKGRQYKGGCFGGGGYGGNCTYADNGSAARFFYCAKASKEERDAGLTPLPIFADDGLPPEQRDPSRKEGNPGGDNPRNRGVHMVHNNHPTVKPLALMKYLVKLVKMPEYNLILDPFMGSGTTLLACIRLGIPCIGIDNDEHTCEIAARRCANEIGELVCT